MTKTKRTKRALLGSALALLVCVSMLIGSTFAWFTDSVTSAGNTIQSGTLQVDLVDADGNSMEGEVIEFVTADNRAQNEILWEPGCTYETEPVYIVNKGNLALKYEIAVNGIDGDAKLLEAIEWTVTVDGVATALEDLNGTLLAGETSKAIVLSGYMKKEAGNEYQGLIAEGISISVFAAQFTSESDSFGDQYDKDADFAMNVNTAADLVDAIKDGGNIALANDIIVSESLPITKDTVLDLNGKNIGTSGSTTGCPLYLKGGKLTVKNGTLDLDGSETNVHGTFATAIGYDAQTELVVENVTFTGQTAINGTFATNGPLTITVSNSTINTTNVGIAVAGESTEAIATVNNCDINAGKYAIFASQGAKITINGGTYKSAENVISSMGNGSVVTVNGGSFEGNLLITNNGALVVKGGTFSTDPSAYVADGCKVLNIDGAYTVVNVKAAEVKAFGLTLIPNGENSKIIVNDKEGFLNLPKLFANWTGLFANGNSGKNFEDYMTEYGGAGTDYYYGGYWTISLEADIDLNNETIDPVTITFPTNTDAITFDGNNHTIKNAKIVMDATTENYAGLFNGREKAAFKDLKLDNIHVSGSNVGNSSAGVLSGSIAEPVNNITITNSSVTGGKYTGGVVGYGYTDITNCSLTNVTVKGGYKLGGVIGYICANNDGTADVTGNTLTNCTVDGIGGGVFAGGKSEYIIGKIAGNYNGNGTCNNNTVTGMTPSIADNIGKIEAGKTVTQ